MGYETRLVIGRGGMAVVTEDREGVEVYFQVYAVIDLCKCGGEANISNIDWKAPDKSPIYYFYQGEEKVLDDCYGDRSRPVRPQEVIDALKKDVAAEDYRRFRWALDLLESMVKDEPELAVLFACLLLSDKELLENHIVEVMGKQP